MVHIKSWFSFSIFPLDLLYTVLCFALCPGWLTGMDYGNGLHCLLCSGLVRPVGIPPRIQRRRESLGYLISGSLPTQVQFGSDYVHPPKAIVVVRQPLFLGFQLSRFWVLWLPYTLRLNSSQLLFLKVPSVFLPSFAYYKVLNDL